MKTHGLAAKISYKITRFFICPLIRLIWVKKHENIHHIKKHTSSGAIIAANHQSFFDFLCLVSVTGRNIHFISAEKFFTHPLWKRLMKLTGQIKVDRKNPDKSEVHLSVGHHLSKKHFVGIFPEGTRSPYRLEMLKAYTGIAKYALQHKVPIIPVGIRGTFDIHNLQEKKLRFKKHAEISVGQPMYFDRFYGKENDAEILVEVTERVIERISELSGKTYPHYEKLNK